MIDSKKIYAELAPNYHSYMLTREAYLNAVDRIIIKYSKKSIRFLDIGSGNGLRAIKISNEIHPSNMTLVDNCEEMINVAKKISQINVTMMDITEPITQISARYDTITMLWNVLGHIPNRQKRKSALNNIKNMLSEDGVFITDLNNRYNYKQYGLVRVLVNIWKDAFSKFYKNIGDFHSPIVINNKEVNSSVHIYNPFEIERLFKEENLVIKKRFIINYKTGELEKNIFGGQLLYILSKSE